MHHPRCIPLHLQLARLECPLFPDQNVEIVVRRVDPRVPLRAERGAKDDEVFSDAGVDNIHRAHCAACVIEDPLGLVWVYAHDGRGRGVGLCQVRDDVGYDSRCVVGRGGDGGVGELVEEDGVKDVPPVLRIGIS